MGIGSHAGAVVAVWPPSVIVCIRFHFTECVAITHAIERSKPVALFVTKSRNVEAISRLFCIARLPGKLPPSAKNKVALLVSDFLQMGTQLLQESHLELFVATLAHGRWHHDAADAAVVIIRLDIDSEMVEVHKTETEHDGFRYFFAVNRDAIYLCIIIIIGKVGVVILGEEVV